MTRGKTWFDNLFSSEGAQDLLLNILEQAADHADTAKLSYGSEIERALATAMCAVCSVSHPEIGFHATPNRTEEEARQVVRNIREASVDQPLWGSIFPQVKIDDYRVDFLILHSRGLSGIGGIVVECDGHEFHEKTKEQAARDKARDRFFQQERGYKVFRYAGSEIWRDALRCARDVIMLASSEAIDAENARFLYSEGDIPGAMKALSWTN